MKCLSKPFTTFENYIKMMQEYRDCFMNIYSTEEFEQIKSDPKIVKSCEDMRSIMSEYNNSSIQNIINTANKISNIDPPIRHNYTITADIDCKKIICDEYGPDENGKLKCNSQDQFSAPANVCEIKSGIEAIFFNTRTTTVFYELCGFDGDTTRSLMGLLLMSSHVGKVSDDSDEL